jgi:thioredoxin-related protein
MSRFLILIFTITVTGAFSLSAQTANQEDHKDLVEWMTLTEALEKQKTQPKKIFVDIYTDWCGWCKVMSKNTFSHQQIAGYINQYFYPVRFDAETLDTIHYLGKDYVNKNEGKRRPTHELAYLLTNNRPSYPTISYLDETGKLIQALPGYMDVKKIEPFLVYFNENAFRTSPFESFKSNFENTFNDSIPNGTGRVQWVSFEDAQKLAKSAPKPLLINISTTFSITSRVMNATTYTDQYTADYINKHFYAVQFDPTTKDSISFGGKTYVNQGVSHPFHDLALMLTNRQIGIPASIYLNENLELLSNVPGYRAPEEFETLLTFFGESIYKTKPWADFIKEFTSKRTPPKKKKEETSIKDSKKEEKQEIVLPSTTKNNSKKPQ